MRENTDEFNNKLKGERAGNGV